MDVLGGHAAGQTEVTAQFQLRKLKVAELKEVLRQLGLKRSGLKNDLLERCRGYMRDYPMQLNATASLIQQQYVQSTAQPAGGAGRAPGGPGRTPLAGRAMAQFGAAPRVGMFSAAPLRFVDTPFLENIVELATPVRLDCNQDYGPVHKYLRMQMSHAAVMATTLNPRLRPYLRCGKLENGVLISSFPRMIRWVCGGTAISEVAQARYCPIEISKYILGWRLAGKFIQFEILQANRFDPVDNSVLQTYAAQVILAEPVPVPRLVDLLRQRVEPVEVGFQRVLAEVRQVDAEQDEDVVLRKVVVSLNCPLSQTRIELPGRGVHCEHLQCVDATYFLKINSRRETWLCPICNKHNSVDELRLDGWMASVLAEAEPDVNDIEINADGTWVAVADDELTASAARDESRKRRRVGNGKKPMPSAGSAGASAASIQPFSGSTQQMFSSLLTPYGDSGQAAPTGLGGAAAMGAGPSLAAGLGADLFPGADLFQDLQQYLGAAGAAGDSISHLPSLPSAGGLREDEPICIFDSD